MTKFAKVRYIRAAAIDNVMTEGSWNICVAKRHKSLFHVVAIKRTRLNESESVQPVILYRFTGTETTIPFKFKMMNTCTR